MPKEKQNRDDFTIAQWKNQCTKNEKLLKGISTDKKIFQSFGCDEQALQISSDSAHQVKSNEFSKSYLARVLLSESGAWW